MRLEERLGNQVSSLTPIIKKIERQIGVGAVEITEIEKQYVMDVLESGRLTYGPYCRRFEQAFARFHQCNYATVTHSGTGALHLAVDCLRQLHGWEQEDEVILPAVTFVATANVIIQNGLRPVFVDVCPRTYNIDPAKIEEKITNKTKAIMVVHLFGQVSDMDPILEIAKKYQLLVIEDSCETMFAKYKGRPAGSFGDISCFSTYTAHLIVTGVGGIACTNNKEYSIVLKSLANHGRHPLYLNIDDDKDLDKTSLSNVISKRFYFNRIGYSSRITEMEAALGLAQLERKDQMLAKRYRNANYLIEGLRHLEDHFQLPWWPDHSEHAFMMFPVVIRPESAVTKEALVNYLEMSNIETRDMLPLINQPIYRQLYGNMEDSYPVAKWINQKGFYIGCHQLLTEHELDYMIDIFGRFFSL